MVKVSAEDMVFLKKNIDNYEELLSRDSPNYLLDVLFYIQAKEGFEDYYYNAFGEEIQKVYDSIYFLNE